MNKKDKEKQEQLKKLVIARLDTLPPNVSISVGSDGQFNKKELIEQIKNDTNIGKKMIEIEIEYMRMLKKGNFMPQAVVITRPFYDLTTSYLHRWSLDVVTQVRDGSSSVVDLEGKRANRKELESVIKKLKPEVIILNGHGAADLMLGQDHKVLLKVGENEYILKDSNVFVLSCSSA